jgi:hypothetical protein
MHCVLNIVSGYPVAEGGLVRGGSLLRTVRMDSDKRSAQVERLEVAETGRQRRWSEDEKRGVALLQAW